MSVLRIAVLPRIIQLIAVLTVSLPVNGQDFSSFVHFCRSDTSPGSALGDVNGDGHLDLAFGNGRHLPQPNLLYINGSARDVFFPPRPLGNAATYAVSLVDLDGDRDLDLVEGNDFGFANVIWTNDGHGNFATSFFFGIEDRTRDLAVGDLTGDGFADIVTANFAVQPNEASKVYVNDGRGLFREVRPLTVSGADAAGVALGDFNGDRHLDIVLGNLAGHPNYLYLNDGAGRFGNPVAFGPREDDTQSIAVADLDGDKRLDVVAGNLGQPDKVYFGDGSGNFSRSITFGPPGGRTRAVAIGDIDGNGTLDIAVGYESIDIRAMGPDGPTTASPEARGPIVFEYRVREEMNRVFLNDGRGNLRPGPTFGTPGMPTRSIVLGDVDGDRRLDIVVGNNCANNAIYLNRAVMAR